MFVNIVPEPVAFVKVYFIFFHKVVCCSFSYNLGMFFVASIAVLDVTSSKAVVGSPRNPPEYIILEVLGYSLFE